MTAGDPRWWAVSTGAARLTPDEQADGWHFCREFDLDLTGPDDIDPSGRCVWCRLLVQAESFLMQLQRGDRDDDKQRGG